jgi:AraC-like DNA-binding protein
MLSDLRLASRSISSVAFEVGFGDLSYFNRAFRRCYGATPSEVKRSAETIDIASCDLPRRYDCD